MQWVTGDRPRSSEPHSAIQHTDERRPTHGINLHHQQRLTADWHGVRIRWPLTSFTLTNAVLNAQAQNVFGRHVTICITQAGSLAGYTYSTKIFSDNGSGTLTMLDACPFVGA